MSQALGSDVSRAKSYLRLLLSKVKLDGSSVTLVAKKNILLGTMLANHQPQLAAVPTAGQVRLRGTDDVRTFLENMTDEIQIPAYAHPP